MEQKPPPISMIRKGHLYVRMPWKAGYDELLADQRIQSGEPCIRGTRIPVYALYGRYKAGESVSVIAKDYELPEKLIQAAIDYADGK